MRMMHIEYLIDAHRPCLQTRLESLDSERSSSTKGETVYFVNSAEPIDIIGYQKVYRQDNQDYQDVQEKPDALHISTSERVASINAKGECTPTLSQGMPHFDVLGIK